MDTVGGDAVDGRAGQLDGRQAVRPSFAEGRVPGTVAAASAARRPGQHLAAVCEYQQAAGLGLHAPHLPLC